MSVSLDDAMEFLYGAGEVVHGWSGDRAELIQAAEQRFPGKAFCLVKRWIIVEIPANEVEPLPDGIAPMIVLAHEVIYDSRGRFVPGCWVRSTYAISHEHPWILRLATPSICLSATDTRSKPRSRWFCHFVRDDPVLEARASVGRARD